MQAWSVLALLATGCLSVQTGGNISVAMTDTPVRRLSGPFLVGTWFPIKQLVIEPSYGLVLGPVGNKSESVLNYGARVLTHSAQLRPGYFAAASGGFQHTNVNAGDTRMIRTSVGIAWSGFKRDPDPEMPFYRTWRVLAVGLVYTHHRQDRIGSGDFLGLELTVTLGLSALDIIDSVKNFDTNQK